MKALAASAAGLTLANNADDIRTPSHWVSFDTLPLIDDLMIPSGRWNTTNVLEPITKTFPEWGKGGATQAITNQPIRVDRLAELPTGAGK